MEVWIKQKPWRMFAALFAVGFVTGAVLDLTLFQSSQRELSELILRNIFAPFFMASIGTMLIFNKEK